MGRGRSKIGSSGVSMSYGRFMELNEEQKDNFIARVIQSVSVPDGLKDTPTLRVLVALGMDGKPQMVSESELDAADGIELFRTIHDVHGDTGGELSANDIFKEFTTNSYSSMSDVNGSSEGRGYYFAKELDGAVFWGVGEKDDLTMRAKVGNGAKLMDVDSIFYGDARKAYVGDTHFHDTMRANNVDPWDAVSIYGIKNGYQGAHATDSGTGAKEIVVYDRSILKISNTTKKIPVWYEHGDNISWDEMK